MNGVAVPSGFGGIASQHTLLTENNWVASTHSGSEQPSCHISGGTAYLCALSFRRPTSPRHAKRRRVHYRKSHPNSYVCDQRDGRRRKITQVIEQPGAR